MFHPLVFFFFLMSATVEFFCQSNYSRSPLLIFVCLYFASPVSSGQISVMILEFHAVCVHAKLLQFCLTLCDPTDHRLPGSSVHEILQERILEQVVLSSSRGSFQPRARTHISYISVIGRCVFLPLVQPGKPIDQAATAAAKSFQSCPTLCDLIDGSPTGSPVSGILQARTLEWVSISTFLLQCMKVKSQSAVPQS